METQFLEPINATSKTGHENLAFDNSPIGYTLQDFWRWSLSDMLSNAARGRFAEFIVGTAIDLKVENLRHEWGAYDLITKDGIKIEVKSSAYIQSWKQAKFSVINFSIKAARHVEKSSITMQRGEAKRHADIYVFCLLKHKDQKTIDPLKLEQWEFYVLPTCQLDSYKRSKSSITLPSLQKLTDSITYQKLKNEIYSAFEEQNQSSTASQDK